jgi:hypothetical protein
LNGFDIDTVIRTASFQMLESILQERDGGRVCVCVCVCVWERERGKKEVNRSHINNRIGNL